MKVNNRIDITKSQNFMPLNYVKKKICIILSTKKKITFFKYIYVMVNYLRTLIIIIFFSNPFFSYLHPVFFFMIKGNIKQRDINFTNRVCIN